MAESVSAKRAAATERIIKRTVELLMEHPDATVHLAWVTAEYEDLIIYGDPDAPTPRGILNG